MTTEEHVRLTVREARALRAFNAEGERKAVQVLAQGEWPDNPNHGVWRAECMVAWLKAAGIALVARDGNTITIWRCECGTRSLRSFGHHAEPSMHRLCQGTVRALTCLVLDPADTEETE